MSNRLIDDNSRQYCAPATVRNATYTSTKIRAMDTIQWRNKGCAKGQAATGGALGGAGIRTSREHGGSWTWRGSRDSPTVTHRVNGEPYERGVKQTVPAK